jgi:hypothetical protein
MSKPEILWGAEAIGREINRTKRQVYHIADRGLLRSIRRVGNSLCANRNALLAEIGGIDPASTLTEPAAASINP